MSQRNLLRYTAFCIIIVLCCGMLIAKPRNTSLEIPKLKKGEEIVTHTGFSLVYSEPDEQAKWVAYTLTKEHAAGDVAERKNNFISDPKVKTGSAEAKWYAKTGYDKGHLCPANDNTWSVDAMHDCFYMSNMSPQLPDFNRGIWKNLEMDIHNLALQYDTLYIVTGPVLKSKHKLKSIQQNGHPEPVEGQSPEPVEGQSPEPVIPAKAGTHAVLNKPLEDNSITIPEYFYKVILVYGKEPRAWGYIIPQNTTEKDYKTYTVPVDTVEKATGIDFFPSLDDKVERRVEREKKEVISKNEHYKMD